MSDLKRTARIQLIVFTLNDLDFAVPIGQVWRVVPLSEQTMTRVPRAPVFLEGVVNVRGRVVPVLDLKKRFGLPETPYSPKARLLVVEMDEHRVGLIVDTVSSILWFPTAQIEPPPPMIAQISGAFVQGVAQDERTLLIILDLQQVLNLEERGQLAGIEVPTE